MRVGLTSLGRIQWKFKLVLCCGCFLLILSLVLSLGFGAVSIQPEVVSSVLWYKVTGIKIGSWSPSRELIVCQVRAPRTLLALLTGGGLAVVGGVMQAIVRNSMADPYLLGLSAGASTGAALGIFLGSMAGIFILPVSVMAFLGALAAFTLVYFISSNSRQLLPGRLILAGISTAYLFSSLTSLLAFLASEHSLREITHWLLGSVSAGKWSSLPLPAIIVFLGFFLLWSRSRELNVIALGDETAVSLGVTPHVFRKFMFFITSLVTGVLVAETGSIGFVGLMIPHFIRLLGVSDYAKLLPLSFIVGAIFLIWADVMARTVFSPEELPIGIVTSLCGAPCFIWILKNQNNVR